jgi:hypothetical protein
VISTSTACPSAPGEPPSSSTCPKSAAIRGSSGTSITLRPARRTTPVNRARPRAST